MALKFRPTSNTLVLLWLNACIRSPFLVLGRWHVHFLLPPLGFANIAEHRQSHDEILPKDEDEILEESHLPILVRSRAVCPYESIGNLSESKQQSVVQ
jgi:hypothetical protein